MRQSGMYADGVDDGYGLGTAKIAQVDAGHYETGNHVVDTRGQRDADRRIVQCLDQLVLHVVLAVAPGDAAVDADDVSKVAGLHATDVDTVARETFEIVAGPGAVIDFERCVFRRSRRIVAWGRVLATAHRAIDDVV